MQQDIEAVKAFYDENPQKEWERFDTHPSEFFITTKMMERLIRPGEHILDIGGGPGRYSIYFAQRGCDVTLLDLSEGNAAFAREKAAQMGLPLKTFVGDAREADTLIEGEFDHVFLMGPLYHLLEEADRVRAVNEAIAKLKPGGKLYASFILLFGGLVFAMKHAVGALIDPAEEKYIDAILHRRPFCGDGFTKVYSAWPEEIAAFMEQFSLKKLHLIGQEGILSPGEANIFAQPQEVVDKWVEVAVALCEHKEFFSFAEHLMYIGEKQ